jgi:ABC-type Na+ efflux pump permease subunit
MDNLALPVLLITICVPAAVRNMVSYSIGGERSYKTGESLLSTPLNVKMIFLAKCAMPMIIALAMIAVSSVLTLTGVNIISRFMNSSAVEMYSAVQFILIYPYTIMACIITVFINGILSVMMKTPRSALYASTLLQLVLYIPSAVIIFLNPANAFMLAAIYAATLMLINIVLFACISGNVRRPWLMSKL